MNLKNIIGKKVYSIYEGEVVGTVMNINFRCNYLKISALTIFDEEEEEYSLPLASIYAIGDCIIIKNKTKLNEFVLGRNFSTISKEVFDENANKLGIIDNIEFDKTGIIQKFITSTNKELNPQFIRVRKSFVLYSENKVKISNLKPRTNNINLSKIKVNVLNMSNINEGNFLPSKLQFNPESLLGRISKGDLVGLNNEIIIKANHTISSKTIQEATRHNRLNQLYYLAQ